MSEKSKFMDDYVKYLNSKSFKNLLPDLPKKLKKVELSKDGLLEICNNPEELRKFRKGLKSFSTWLGKTYGHNAKKDDEQRFMKKCEDYLNSENFKKLSEFPQSGKSIKIKKLTRNLKRFEEGLNIFVGHLREEKNKKSENTSSAMQRAVSKLFSDPSKDRKASTAWLLIYCVSKFGEKGAKIKQTQNVLTKLLKKIRSKDKSFFLIWPPEWDLKDNLQLFTELGYLDEIIEEGSEDPIYRINSEGKKLLITGKKYAPQGISF